eukprot:239569_1
MYCRINVPTTIDGILSRMTDMGISSAIVNKFEDEIDDSEYDISIIQEDISDEKQSLVLQFFKDTVGSASMFYIVKAIINGTMIDYLLGKYYESCGIPDYYDENNDGKFVQFLNDFGLKADAIIAELE